MTGTLASHREEIESGTRFEFGENWTRFLALLNEDRIAEAENSLRKMLDVENLEGKSFIDIGSGSGLFSLAARRLGARVHSFDFDPKSVACTRELKRRFFADDLNWTINEASALDKEYIGTLGQFDVVYSWGVLHHTGQMWQALENVTALVKPRRKLFIAIYNDTGSQAARWTWIKKTYNDLPRSLRAPFAALMILPEEAKNFTKAMLTLKPGDYIKSWTAYDKSRGMNRWRDIIDWVGGYPYEVATPDEIFDFYRERDFELDKMRCGGVGLGCNEFVFTKK
ncbi:MAG TPA: class I SAM-dependent methyltransferase [Pyrinomonadaceae bacterium]|nr:class I SAM-dependent methyltransferase [Pyrinomonadaceae bacterium]